MPVHPVKKNGKVVGYQWGHSGKVYSGTNAKGKATAQGRAAYANGYREPASKKTAAKTLKS